MARSDIRLADIIQESTLNSRSVQQIYSLFNEGATLPRDQSGISFIQANFAADNLSGYNLSDASFREARLVGTNLSGASCIGTEFNEADLTGADLRGTDLSGAFLTHAILDGIQIDEQTNVAGARILKQDRHRFRQCRGFESLKIRS